ncbi:MAG: redox-sensing transcriptional repressor Rex [Clostridia bacterium]|nr:redox-sensing transcriptional repressor Rex [Clostridia bacterium]
MSGLKISKASLARLPIYLDCLKSLPHSAGEYTSAAQIASALKLGEIQVRKDLAAVSQGGKPRIGYKTESLINDIESYLGYNKTINAVLVGAGKLGKALLEYSRFSEYGLDIVAAFDISEDNLGSANNGKIIYHLDNFSEICKNCNAQIGIITVPCASAQDVCSLMVESGIKAIWNFASSHLDVPEDVWVQNENMAASVALLSGHLTNNQKIL